MASVSFDSNRQSDAENKMVAKNTCFLKAVISVLTDLATVIYPHS
jgi:hypothetical protein